MGDRIGDWKIVSVDNQYVVFEWDGKEFKKRIDELMDQIRARWPKPRRPAAAAAASAPRRAKAQSLSDSSKNRTTGWMWAATDMQGLQARRRFRGRHGHGRIQESSQRNSLRQCMPLGASEMRGNQLMKTIALLCISAALVLARSGPGKDTNEKHREDAKTADDTRSKADRRRRRRRPSPAVPSETNLHRPPSRRCLRC